VPTQRQCSKNRHRSRCQWRQNPREQNDRDKGSEEYGPKKTPTFRPSDLHGNQLGADTKQRLGAEHVTDFLIAERHSFGFAWQAVELESPLRPMFNKNGDPSRHLNHALRQLTDWRAWLKANQSYAARPRSEGGLGLTDIDANVKGLVLIGRRANIPDCTAARRRQMVQDLNVDIHSYDYLLSALKGRLDSLRIAHGERNEV
jgi:hypothetical protein